MSFGPVSVFSVYRYCAVDFDLRREAPVPVTGQKVRIDRPRHALGHMIAASVLCCFVKDVETGESLGLVPLRGLDQCLKRIHHVESQVVNPGSGGFPRRF